MGEKYDPIKYKKIIQCVGMNLSKYKGGDMIEVLKFGQNFSISERKFILLAR
jgi:hypothetical protein